MVSLRLCYRARCLVLLIFDLPQSGMGSGGEWVKVFIYAYPHVQNYLTRVESVVVSSFLL